MTKKFVSWNVNGIRAALKKGFMESFEELNPDIIGLQEIKLSEGQLDLEIPGYHMYWNYAEKKGYSGTAVFTREEPLSVSYGLGIEEHDKEGRVITLEYPEYYFITCYTPNSQRGLARLDYRMDWEEAFLEYLNRLNEVKPIVLCGDLNVAHNEIDLKNPESNRKNAGFSDEERDKFTKLLDAGYTDTFRYLYPGKEDEYSWWSYFRQARDRNIGWRIDYFVVSKVLDQKIVEASIHQNIMGSDHCPVSVELNL